MKVSKAQVQENRARIVEVAAALFRERGYDGVGIADLMGAAGLTHGGFYKHFRSKADLMAEAAAFGIAHTAAQNSALPSADFVQRYLSRAHRDARDSGCTIAALSGDAARQSEQVKATFAAGIEASVAAVLSSHVELAGEGYGAARAAMLNTLAHAVGALVLSRACPDDAALADEILQVCRQHLLAALPAQVGGSEDPLSGAGKA